MAAPPSSRFFIPMALLLLAAVIGMSVPDDEWGCANYRGYCRKTCFPQEKTLGPEDCPEDLICCVSGPLG